MGRDDQFRPLNQSGDSIITAQPLNNQDVCHVTTGTRSLLICDTRDICGVNSQICNDIRILPWFVQSDWFCYNYSREVESCRFKSVSAWWHVCCIYVVPWFVNVPLSAIVSDWFCYKYIGTLWVFTGQLLIYFINSKGSCVFVFVCDASQYIYLNGGTS